MCAIVSVVGLIPLNLTKSLDYPQMACQENTIEYSSKAIAVMYVFIYLVKVDS